MKNILLIIFCSLLITLPSCSKKADGDEEIRKMIVGSWGRAINHCTFCGKDTEILEFSEDGRYREIWYEGTMGGWGKADTTGIAGAFHVENHISFEDSVYYEIDNGILSFYTFKDQLAYSSFGLDDTEIKSIKPNVLKFKYIKYEKK